MNQRTYTREEVEELLRKQRELCAEVLPAFNHGQVSNQRFKERIRQAKKPIL